MKTTLNRGTGSAALPPLFDVPRLLVALGLLLLLGGLLYGCSEKAKKPAEAPPRRVTILYFNDFHGHLLPFPHVREKKPTAGFARLATLVRQIRTENDKQSIDTLLLSAGDNVQGSPMSTAFRGRAEMDAFNALGLTASAVGNHDFDYGAETLFEMVERADFPFLSATAYQMTGSDLVFEPYLIHSTKNGLKIAVIGLTTEDAPITTHPKNVLDYRFTKPELAIQRYYDQLDKESDLIVALSHLGYPVERHIADAFMGVDVIIGGHSHTKLDTPDDVGGVLVCQTGDRGLHLGRLDLEVFKDRAKVIQAVLIPVTSRIAEDPKVKAAIDVYEKKMDEEIQKVIGKAGVLLDGERANVRTRETNLGNLTTDLIRQQSGAEAAMINSGVIRASFLPGDINLAQVMRVFPMNNLIVAMDLTGDDIRRALKRSIKGLMESGPDELYGGFLQVSGINFSIVGGKLAEIEINGQPLDPNRIYRVATIEFLSAGGDGYKEFENGKNKYFTGITLRDMFVNYIKSRPTIRAEVEGRILRENSEK